MTLAGAGLDDAEKETLKDLNQRISTLTTRFEKNLLADTNELAVHVTDAAELDGLDAGELSATAQAAADRELDGWLLTLVLPTGHPYLAALTHRGLRQRLMAASRDRGSHGGDFDNRELVLEIARLRADRAALLGFASHAAAVTADETAGTPEAVAEMLTPLAASAAKNAREEQADLDAMNPDEVLEASDWAFYTEKVRQAKFDVDTAALRPWFEAERVLQDGVFFAATELYGVTFTERPDLVAYHPDARIFEVSDADGTGVGLYVLDLYTRDSKRGGAWMNPLISQSDLLQHPVVVVNNLNVPKPAAGEPTLLTFDEVSTFFHEFGHALHGLFARVTYPKLAGTNVYRDFVEFPSQVNEMWMLWPEVLANYAKHHVTGEPLDAGVVERIRASETFNEGFATSEYLAAALLDQAWHTLTPDAARGRDGRRRFRGGRPRRRRARQPGRPHPVLEHVLRPHLLRRLRRGLLLLHLERGARRRHRRVVHRERRPDARERRPVPVAAARRRRIEGPARGVPRVPRSRRGDRAAAEAARARLGIDRSFCPPRGTLAVPRNIRSTRTALPRWVDEGTHTYPSCAGRSIGVSPCPTSSSPARAAIPASLESGRSSICRSRCSARASSADSPSSPPSFRSRRSC